MESTTQTFTTLLLNASLTFAMFAALAGIVAGLWLLFAPRTFTQLEKQSAKSISLRRGLRPLELVRNIDRHIYRHHKVFGLLVITASIFTLYRVLFDVTDGRTAQLFGHLFSSSVGAWLFDALSLILIIGHLFTIIIGLVIYVRPSALKGFETRANQWVSTREGTRWLETRYDLTERLLQSYPRQLGFLILLLSLYLTAVLFVL